MRLRMHGYTQTHSHAHLPSLEHALDAGLRLTLLRPMTLRTPLNWRLASPSEFTPGSSHNYAFRLG